SPKLDPLRLQPRLDGMQTHARTVIALRDHAEPLVDGGDLVEDLRSLGALRLQLRWLGGRRRGEARSSCNEPKAPQTTSPPATPKCSTWIAHDLFASRLTACVVGAPVEPRYFQVKSVEPDRSALSGVHALRPIGLIADYLHEHLPRSSPVELAEFELVDDDR